MNISQQKLYNVSPCVRTYVCMCVCVCTVCGSDIKYSSCAYMDSCRVLIPSSQGLVTPLSFTRALMLKRYVYAFSICFITSMFSNIFMAPLASLVNCKLCVL